MKNLIKEWVIPLGVAVVLALVINRFVFFNIKVPTLSMYPTIKANDRILVTRVYNPKNLERGDVIVFYLKEKDERLIKRLIGLPGDKVEVKDDGTVWVNGEKLDEPYVENPGGPSGTYVVPEDGYFFLGDNRTDSLDSRLWTQGPYISSSDILGKGQFTIFPFDRFGKLK
ncbi:MAG: signal peptidase I [Clostridiaceae bacterium]